MKNWKNFQVTLTNAMQDFPTSRPVIAEDFFDAASHAIRIWVAQTGYSADSVISVFVREIEK